MKIVGLAGGTASGKTTLATLLATQLGDRGLLIAHDRYYRTLPESFRGREIDYNFDHPDALNNEQLAADLRALSQGNTIRVPHYDFKSCSQLPEAEWETFDPTGVEVVIVEGILVLAIEALRAQFDRRFFVHTPADVRLARRLKRDIVERGDTVQGVLNQYMATVRPMHQTFVEPSKQHAEQVLDGMADLDHTVAELARALRSA